MKDTPPKDERIDELADELKSMRAQRSSDRDRWVKFALLAYGFTCGFLVARSVYRSLFQPVPEPRVVMIPLPKEPDAESGR